MTSFWEGGLMCKYSLIRCAAAYSLLVFVLSFASPSASAADAKSATKLKGLIITGGCCHDYDRQNLILSEGLSQRVSISWDIVHEGDPNDRSYKISIYNNPNWSAGYDVVVHNECYGHMDDAKFLEGIVRGHTQTGIGAVVLHCSMHSYREAPTDEWRKLLGVTSRRHEKGGRELDVKPVATGNPIMKGTAPWTTAGDELYVIENVWPNCTALATAKSVDTNQDHVVIWTNTYQKARVFGTTLGHNNLTMSAEPWLDTVARGLLWSIGKLNDDGTPAAGYAGTGKAPFSFELAQATGQPKESNWAKSIKLPASEKPIELFNGTDFTGWEGHTDKYFSVKDGIIVAKNTKDNAPPVSTYLLTKKPYQNFRLLFEGKLVESAMHSGIALWGKKFEKDSEQSSYQGHLVMFPSGWGYYDLFRRNSIYKDDGRAKKADNVGGWNRMEILAISPRIRLAVNGKEVADWTDPKPELVGPGPIGLQLHSNKVPQEVHFRGLILSENPEDRLITVEK
jgi:type 1 glutamine amidotransferase